MRIVTSPSAPGVISRLAASSGGGGVERAGQLGA